MRGTREGLDAARARGRTGGRPSAITSDQFRFARQLGDKHDARGRREYTITQIAEMLGVRRPTLYRALEPVEPATSLRTPGTPGRGPIVIKAGPARWYLINPSLSSPMIRLGFRQADVRTSTSSEDRHVCGRKQTGPRRAAGLLAS
jgi:hypothetical protein